MCRGSRNKPLFATVSGWGKDAIDSIDTYTYVDFHLCMVLVRDFSGLSGKRMEELFGFLVVSKTWRGGRCKRQATSLSCLGVDQLPFVFVYGRDKRMNLIVGVYMPNN